MEGNFFRNSGHRCQLEEEVQSGFTTTSPSLHVSSTRVFTQVSETSAPLMLRAAAQGPQNAQWCVRAKSTPPVGEGHRELGRSLLTASALSPRPKGWGSSGPTALEVTPPRTSTGH